MSDGLRDRTKAASNDMGVPAFLARSGADKGARREGDRVRIFCPAHHDEHPSCDVEMVRGEIVFKCRSAACGVGGGVFDLVAMVKGLDVKRDFVAVLKETAAIAGVDEPAVRPSPVAPPPRRAPAASPPRRVAAQAAPPAAGEGERKEHPPREEVLAVWEAAQPLAGDPAAVRWCAERGLEPARIAQLELARVLPQGAQVPAWAQSWARGPWRLVISVFDSAGELRSFVARDIRTREERAAAGGGPKTLAPKGYSTKGLLFATSGALNAFHEGRPAVIVAAEGDVDFLTWATRSSAVIGLPGEGRWSEEWAKRIPTGSKVAIWTDADAAGRVYASAIARDVHAHAPDVAVYHRPEHAPGAPDGPDVDELACAGVLPHEPLEGLVEVVPPPSLEAPDEERDAIEGTAPAQEGAEDGPDVFGPALDVATVLAAVKAAPTAQRHAVACDPRHVSFAAALGPLDFGTLVSGLAGQSKHVRLKEWRRAVEAARPAPPPPPSTRDGKPVIRIVSGKRDAMSECATEIIGARDSNLYCRAGRLVHITSTTEETRKRYPFLPLGSPVIHVMCHATLGCRLSKFIAWEKPRGDRFVPADPPDPVIQAILAAGDYPTVRPLVSYSETPMLRRDGSIVEDSGYDPLSGYLYQPAEIFPRVPENPTREDAQAAFAMWWDAFIDWPFESDADRAVPIAHALTLLARSAIDGNTPFFAYDAATPGTGKGLAVEVVHRIVTGRIAGSMTYPSDAKGANEEVRKVLDTMANVGARSGFFDNVKAGVEFGGSSLEKIATTGIHEARVMGRNTEMTSVPWTAVVCVTGNNLCFSSEMPRRVLRARMVSPFERPEERPLDSYVHPERAGTDRMVAWVMEHRPALVIAALTMLRAYILAGRPSCARRIGSFEPWSDLIAGAIVWAGGPDPIDCLLTAGNVEESPLQAAHRTLVNDLPRFDHGHGVIIRDLLAALYPPERVRGQQVPPDNCDGLREALEHLSPPLRPGAAPDGRRLGHALRTIKDRLVSGRKLAHPRGVDGKPLESRDGAARWVVLDGNGAPIRST